MLFFIRGLFNQSTPIFSANGRVSASLLLPPPTLMHLAVCIVKSASCTNNAHKNQAHHGLIKPTKALIGQTTAPIELTKAPVKPPKTLIQPTIAPIEPTKAPIKSTMTLIKPMIAPNEPTKAPIKPMMALIKQTMAPIESMKAPIGPTMAPTSH
jgi:hypothetical protein